tara:strand:- start:219 stop:830 length:612 start_codon:yes stop_codon:yes gene_type:complete
MEINYITDPWECVEIENFLPEDRWEKIQELAKIELDNYNSSMTRQRRGHYVNYLHEDIIPETNSLFTDISLPHREYKGKLKKLVHWTISKPDWYYPPHCDNRSRISTSILYVSPDNSDGTILHKNISENDKGDHEKANLPSTYTCELSWKPNKVFFHNSIPNKTWHSIQNTTNTPRIVLCSFLVQEDLVLPNRPYSGYEISIN